MASSNLGSQRCVTPRNRGHDLRQRALRHVRSMKDSSAGGVDDRCGPSRERSARRASCGRSPGLPPCVWARR
jgi:hypothetical protein